MVIHAILNLRANKSHKHTIKIITIENINQELYGGIHDTKFWLILVFNEVKEPQDTR